MEIKYYDFECDFTREIIDNDKTAVYVFNNYYTKEEAEKYYNKPFLKKESLFLTFRDFKEKISASERIVLREEKLTAIFYELLTEKEKKILQIDEYFDVIELSSNFYNFFGEIEEYNPDKTPVELLRKIDLKAWQEEKINIFLNLRQRYLEYMKKNNYIDERRAFSKENFNLQYFNDYNTIIFVNKLNFTEKEKDMLDFLEKENIDVKLYLQLKEGDFDEVNLKLDSFTLPDNITTEINIYKVEERILQLANLFLKFDNENLCILDADFENNNYHKFLASDKVQVNKKRSFTETAIFHFLNYLYEIFTARSRVDGFLKLEIDSFLQAVYSEEFNIYYGLKEKEKNVIQELADSDYVYITEELLKDKDVESIQKVIFDIKKLEKVNNLDEIIEFLEKLDITKINDRLFSDNLQAYVSSLHEMSSLRETEIIDDWNKYFSDKAQGLFKFCLNYFRYKEVKEINDNERTETQIKIEDLINAGEYKRKNVGIINASSGIIPSKVNDFILDDSQRKKLGLRIIDDKQLEERYYFMCHVLNSEQADIFCLRSIEDNISESSFAEELALEYNLEIKEAEYGSGELNEVLEQVFGWPGESFYQDSERNIPADFSQEKLIKTKKDFSGDISSLSYYRYKHMKNCQYRYYLQYLASLEEMNVEVDRQMSMLVFGTMVHEIFAEVVERANVELVLDKVEIDDIVESIWRDYDLKINNFFRKYYNRVLKEKVKDSALFFLNEFKKRSGGGVQDLLLEWSPEKTWENVFYSSELVDFYLNGRIDLLARGENVDYIVDFKTGGSNNDQLNLYDLMLEMAEGENEDGPGDKGDKVKRKEKMFYNVMDEKLKKSYKNKEKFRNKLQDVLDEFTENNFYKREYTSQCKRCPYYDICRVVIK